MEFEGIIKKIYKEETITKKDGWELKLQSFVVEEKDQEYPNAMPITLIGDKVSIIKKYKEGQNVRVWLNFKANENKDWTKAFPSITARRIESLDSATVADDTEGDLPF